MHCAMKKVPDNDLDQLFADALGSLKAEAPEKVWRSVSSVISTGGATVPGLLSRLIKPATWFSSGIILLIGSYLTINSFKDSAIELAIPGLAMNQSNNQRFMPVVVSEQKITSPGDTPAALTNYVVSDQMNEPIVEPNNLNKNLQPSLVGTNEPERIIKYTEIPTLIERLRETAPASINFLGIKEIGLPSFSFIPSVSTQAIDSWFLPPVDYARPITTTLVFSNGPDVFSFDENLFDASRSAGWNTSLSSRFQFSEFFFSAGINLLGIRQRNPYDYTINELLQVGEYTHVDSVVMVETTDSLGNIITIPQYYTSQLPLMDSVPVTHRTQVYDHYRFLEIPFTIGMRKDYKRFSFTAQAGFAYTFNIDNNEMSLDQFEEKSGFQLLDWQKQSFGRLQHFWSFTFALGTSYALNNRFAIGFEPTYRYFVEPFYEGSQPDRKSPFSFGCRFNIHYTL